MGFVDTLRLRARTGFVPVIPDFKRISPSDGPLFPGRDMVDAAKAMERAGAPALSVVTEPRQFGGSLELLQAIVQEVNIPVLRKDFVQSVQDIEETARCGATAVLLICATMNDATLRTLYQASLDCGLEPLVEAHTTAELQLAAELGAQLVGINNRDILTLERDGGTVATTQLLSTYKPNGSFLISESGIRSPADVRTALHSGADAVLVGTAIWKAADPLAFYQTLTTARE